MTAYRHASALLPWLNLVEMVTHADLVGMFSEMTAISKSRSCSGVQPDMVVCCFGGDEFGG